nr:MAG TPA_asm: YadA-like protein [Bacteriophage sp.]
MKLMDSIGIKRFVSKILEVIGNKVANGEWLPIKKGVGSDGNVVQGAVAEGQDTTASGRASHAEGSGTTASGNNSHAEGVRTTASGLSSHAQGFSTTASGPYSHAEGYKTMASGGASHAQGSSNYDDPSFIYMVGVGTNTNSTNIIKQNASVIYVGRDSKGGVDPSNPKNGYQYLIGIGGYQGQAIGTDTKSIQEVIADLDGRITALENR